MVLTSAISTTANVLQTALTSAILRIVSPKLVWNAICFVKLVMEIQDHAILAKEGLYSSSTVAYWNVRISTTIKLLTILVENATRSAHNAMVHWNPIAMHAKISPYIISVAKLVMKIVFQDMGIFQGVRIASCAASVV